MNNAFDLTPQQDFNNGELPLIYFYIPNSKLTGPVPNCAAEYWKWRILMSLKNKNLGSFDWTLQTYLHLKEDGFPCELVTIFPVNGIVLAHKDFLQDISTPNQSTMLICLKSDRSPHPYAQIHIVQNPEDRVEKILEEFAGSDFMPHWVQPMLVSRDPKRGKRFENIGYIGSDFELSDEFKKKSWENTLKRIGFNWIMRTTSDKWSDYSDIDALLSVRKCNNETEEFKFKPATKLYNAWHAGIPAILGVESAYRAERKSEFDYLEANSPEEVINALIRLRDDPDLRDMITRNGEIRAEETKPMVLVKKWENFLLNIVTPAYHKWCSSSWIRRKYYAKCIMRNTFIRIKHRISHKPKFAYGY